VIKRQGAGVQIEKIEVTQIGDVNRAKLYYLREKVGKKARVRAVQRRDKLSSLDAEDTAGALEALDETGEPAEESAAEAADAEPADDVAGEPRVDEPAAEAALEEAAAEPEAEAETRKKAP
jgi:hypothetical protein